MGFIGLNKTAAIFSLGNTHGACRFAIDWILARELAPLDVYVLFGEPASGQSGATPIDALHLLTADPELAARVHWAEQWATQAFSIDRVYSRAVEMMRKIASVGYPRVYVGITGGSNTMVAAVFHAAMNELSGEVIPIYVQGKPGENSQTSIEVSEGTRTRESVAIRQVLRHLAESRVSVAGAIAGELPESGKAGFVRRALRALTAWDRFEYGSAEEFVALLPQAEVLVHDRSLRALAGIVVAFARNGPRVARLEEMYRDPKVFYECRRANPKAVENQVAASGWMLPADALANARRRIAEGLFADSVMRSYRAAEIAIQSRLFLAGVHPSALDWTQPPLTLHADAWTGQFGSLPKSVSFEQALHLVDSVCQTSLAESTPERKTLQLARNHCCLEHGYNRSTLASAERALEQSKTLCASALGRTASGLEFEMLLDRPAN